MTPHLDEPQFSEHRLKRAALLQRALDIIVIGSGVVWFLLIELRWMVEGQTPTWLDGFVGLAFLAMGVALWLNHRSRASFLHLNQSEDLRHQLEDVMSSMADLMILMSPDGTIQRINKVTRDVLGYQQEEMVGQSINHFVAQGSANLSGLDGLHRHNSMRVTRSFRTRAGRLTPMAVTYTAVTARDGSLQGLLCVAQDLSEVESIRAQLQTTNQRYDAAIAFSRLGVYEYDSHTNNLVIDSNLTLLFDGDAKAIKSLDDGLKYVPIEDHAKVYTALHNILTGKNDHLEVEIRVTNQKYGLRWIQIRGAINESDGRLFGTMMDVTSRKAAEDGMESRDAIMRAVADASEMFLHASNWEDNLDNLLRGLGEAAGVSRVYVFHKHLDADNKTILLSQVSEWSGKDVTSKIDNPELKNIRVVDAGFERWVRVLGTNLPLYGAVDTFPQAEQDFLGKQAIKSLLATPIFVNNEWWGLIGFDDCLLPRVWSTATIDALKLAADILGAAISRTQTDKELESGREFMASIMSNLGQGVTVLDGEDNLIYVNPAYAQMVGIHPDQLIGRNPVEFADKDDLTTLEYNRNLRARGMVSSYSTHIRHVDGHLTEVLITGVPRMIDGKFDGAYCVVADITERRKLESQKFELLLEKERVRLMSDFVRDISHEFRTPLSIIQTSLYLLRRKPDHPQASARLDVIGSQASRLNRLVDDLMLMLELEQADIVARMLSLNTIAGHMVEQFRKKADEKHLILTLETPDGEIAINGEEGYLSRALNMLVDNAVEFTPEGGKITVILRTDQDYAVISVKDTGVGIAPAELNNIFEHMYKVDKARNTERGGLGLGLSIVRRISALHHGEVTVESEQGKGSIFTLRLPRPTHHKSKPIHSTLTQEISAVIIRSTDEIDRATT